jgi:hypothetical protein
MYNQQKLRIQIGNRICAAFRFKLGLESSQAEDEDPDASKLLKDLRAEAKRITDSVKRVTKNTPCDSPLITTITELSLLNSYEKMLEAEAQNEKAILDELSRQPIWTDYLINIRGVGTLMAGCILSEIDIHKCNSISALDKYTGLDVVVTGTEDGEQLEEARGMKKSHLVPKTYTNSKGEVKDTEGITYNPFIRAKLLGVLANVFIKLGGDYKVIYDNYKFRIQNMPKHQDKTKLHVHNMCKRYMIKMFMEALWKKWRELEGLPVKGTYAEDVLGIVHHTETGVE